MHFCNCCLVRSTSRGTAAQGIGRRRGAHHTIVKWVFYEEGSISLRYICYALPIFTLVARDVEVAPVHVMVRNVLCLMQKRRQLIIVTRINDGAP